MQASPKILIVEVEWQIGHYRERLWAQLDTGYGGGLVLPSNRLYELISLLGCPDGYRWVELADGSQTQVPYYIGSVSLVGSRQSIPCPIYLMGHKELVGLEPLTSLNILPSFLSVLKSKGIIAEWGNDP